MGTDTNQQKYPHKHKSYRTGEQVIYPELSFKVTGLCFSSHNELGPFAKEKQYADLLEKKLQEGKMVYQRELRIAEPGNIIDFLVENKIALELKAKRVLLPEDFRQIQNYLQASGVKLGLLINFRTHYLKPIRILRLNPKKEN